MSEIEELNKLLTQCRLLEKDLGVEFPETKKEIQEKIDYLKNKAKVETGLMGLTRGEIKLVKDCMLYTRKHSEDEAFRGLIDEIIKKYDDDLDTMDMLSEDINHELDLEEKVCETCNGTGWIEYQDGCHTHKDDCPNCRN